MNKWNVSKGRGVDVTGALVWGCRAGGVMIIRQKMKWKGVHEKKTEGVKVESQVKGASWWPWPWMLLFILLFAYVPKFSKENEARLATYMNRFRHINSLMSTTLRQGSQWRTWSVKISQRFQQRPPARDTESRSACCPPSLSDSCTGASAELHCRSQASTCSYVQWRVKVTNKKNHNA